MENGVRVKFVRRESTRRGGESERGKGLSRDKWNNPKQLHYTHRGTWNFYRLSSGELL